MRVFCEEQNFEVYSYSQSPWRLIWDEHSHSTITEWVDQLKTIVKITNISIPCFIGSQKLGRHMRIALTECTIFNFKSGASCPSASFLNNRERIRAYYTDS